jgi:Xaa-Pro aminopeptidase
MNVALSDRMHEFAQRRAELLTHLGPHSVAIVASTPIATRNSDVEHAFRQDSDLFYLSGFDEPGVVLVVTNQHPSHRFVLFVRPRDAEREMWDGCRAGIEGARARFGADEAYPIGELAEKLPGYLENARRVMYAAGRFPTVDSRVFAALHHTRRRQRLGVLAPEAILEPSALHTMRLSKSTIELDAMRRAAEATAEGHAQAMRVAVPGKHEFDVEAELLRSFRRHGAARPAYDSIVGSGPNACILHYRENDRRMEEGDLCLIDAGAEWGYYAADVTRTFPVSGRFTPAQRRLYDAVLRAQLEAIALTKPGANLELIHQATVRSLTESMLSLGLLKDTSLEQAIEKDEYKKFYPHRTSHWLGMDVHDVGSYHVEDGDQLVPRPLAPGQVLTIEPGLYIPENADVDPQYRGQGIRIEDDVLVTTSGHEVLTHMIPKDPDVLERLLASR